MKIELAIDERRFQLIHPDESLQALENPWEPIEDAIHTMVRRTIRILSKSGRSK